MTARRPFPLHTGLAKVVRIADVTPAMRRFSLQAGDFADFGVEQPGEIVTLGWPGPDQELVLPRSRWRFPPGTPEDQHWRNFTVRAFDPVRSEIDVDFFLHGDAGRAAGWALRAEVGDEVGYAGPRTHWTDRNGAEWSMLVADETGLPALMAILETLPAGHRVTALAEVADDGERQEVHTAADLELVWLTRGGRPPGTSPVLAEALAALEFPEGPGRVWGGGEAMAMRAVRDELGGRGVSRRSMQAMGYWKHDTTPEEMW
jgi:NADPH-dependent ferric siderophore reductase